MLSTFMFFKNRENFKNGFKKEIAIAHFNHTYLAQTPEIGQGLGRFLSCGARKQEQT